MKNSSIYLVLLPGAGETAAGYMAWHQALPCHVVSLEYPGHGTRMDELCATNMKDLVEDLQRSLKKQIPLHSSILLFGYSMGALQPGPWLIKSKGHLIIIFWDSAWRHVFLTCHAWGPEMILFDTWR